MAIRLLIWAPGLGNNRYERTRGGVRSPDQSVSICKSQIQPKIEVAKVAESTHSLSLSLTPDIAPDEFVSLQTHPFQSPSSTLPPTLSLLSIAGPEDCDAYFFFLLSSRRFLSLFFPCPHSLLAPTPPATLRRLKRFSSSQPPEAFSSIIFSSSSTIPSLSSRFFRPPNSSQLQLDRLQAGRHIIDAFLPPHLLVCCQSRAGPNPLFSRYCRPYWRFGAHPPPSVLS